MPIYCYKCFDCEHYEEIKQNMDDEPRSVCPACGKREFKRIIRNVGIIFKGSGFHITDYSKRNTPRDTPKEPPKNGDTAPAKEAGEAKDTKETPTTKAGKTETAPKTGD
jgi:putative FmdB family regulatory protein